MSKKAFALRIDSAILDAMQRWADDDLRSINTQIEFVLRKALRKEGRIKAKEVEPIVDQTADDLGEA